MGGDLNLKKSWHPLLMSNQRRVWEEETKAIEERKRIAQMKKEREEERQIQELQEMQEAAGGRKRTNKVDWMYNGPSSGQGGTTEEQEGYLLGRRRIDGLLKEKAETKKLEKGTDEQSFMALQNANTTRDTAAKVRDDPLFSIKKQEQAAYESMMNDPTKRALLLQAAGVERPDEKRRERRHEKSNGGSHRHRSDDNDGERRHRHRHHKYRHARSRSRSRSRSPPDFRNRSPSPYRSSRRRSRSPYSRSSRLPIHGAASRDYSEDNGRRHSYPRHSPRRSSPPKPHRQDSPSADNRADDRADDRAARLAAMQQAATDMGEDRRRRIDAIAEQEATEREAERAARARSSKLGGKGDFLVGMNRRAAELGVGERIHRGRGGFERDLGD